MTNPDSSFLGSQHPTKAKSCLSTDWPWLAPIYFPWFCHEIHDNQSAVSQCGGPASDLPLRRKSSFASVTCHSFASFHCLPRIVVETPDHISLIFTWQDLAHRTPQGGTMWHYDAPHPRVYRIESDNTAFRPDMNGELSAICDLLCYLRSHLIESQSSTIWKLEGRGKTIEHVAWLCDRMPSLPDPIQIGFQIWGIRAWYVRLK